MSIEFPHLCKWNAFTIDSPEGRWDDDAGEWENFYHSSKAKGDTNLR